MSSKNIMVDLETLGIVPGSVILSIGAVDYDENGVGLREFHVPIYTPSARDVFLTVDSKTEAWWAQQAPQARAIIEVCKDPSKSKDIKVALEYFGNYVRSFGPNALVWGNGSDFDNALLAVAYNVCGMPLPWKFWNNRCYRTLKNLHPDIKLERKGTYHDALDDARCQAEHAARLLLRQRDCAAVWGETQDDEEGEGSGAALQSASAEGLRRGEREADPVGDRLPRQNVPTGLR